VASCPTGAGNATSCCASSSNLPLQNDSEPHDSRETRRGLAIQLDEESAARRILSCARSRTYPLDALQVVIAQIIPALFGIRPEKSPSRRMAASEDQPYVTP